MIIEQTPREYVIAASQKRWQYVYAGALVARAQTDLDLLTGLETAHDWGIEIRGFVPSHVWAAFLTYRQRLARYPG
jgi:hypothetical protein